MEHMQIAIKEKKGCNIHFDNIVLIKQEGDVIKIIDREGWRTGFIISEIENIKIDFFSLDEDFELN